MKRVFAVFAILIFLFGCSGESEEDVKEKDEKAREETKETEDAKTVSVKQNKTSQKEKDSSKSEDGLTELETITLETLEYAFNGENGWEANIDFDPKNKTFYIEYTDDDAKLNHVMLLSEIDSSSKEEAVHMSQSTAKMYLPISIDLMEKEPGYTLIIRQVGTDMDLFQLKDGEIIHNYLDDYIDNNK